MSTLDLYPTLCAAAGVSVPESTQVDGVDLMPYLQGEVASAPHEFLYWHRDNSGAVLKGSWKLHLAGKREQLFNLAEDISESNDLAKEHPEIAAKLRKAYDEFVRRLPEPLNKRARERARARRK